MSNLLFLLTAVHINGCPTPKIVNWSNVWTPQDGKVYAQSLDRCKVHFGDSTPCLKTFIKKKERTYYVVCAPRTSKNNTISSNDRRFWFVTAAPEVEKQQGGTAGGPTNQGGRCNGTCPYQPGYPGGGK